MNHERRSNEDFRLLAEAMPHFVWTALPDGTIDYFNARWLAYTGLEAGSAGRPGATISAKDVVHPDDLQRTWDAWKHSLETGGPYEIEYRLRSKEDGTYRWFLARCIPVRGAGGAIVRWIGTCTDVEERQRTNENLRFATEAAALVAASLDAKKTLERFTQLSIERFADWCFITLVRPDGTYATEFMAHRDPERLAEVAAYGSRNPTRSDSAIANVIRTRQPILVPIVPPDRLREAAIDEGHLKILLSLQMHSVMVVPLAAGDEAFGAITLITAESKRVFDASDLDVALMVCGQTGIALQNARLFEAERTARRRLEFIAKASDRIFQSLDLNEAFKQLLEVVVEDVADWATIGLIENDRTMRVAAVAHRDPDQHVLLENLRGIRMTKPPVEAQLIEALRSRRPQHFEDTPDRITAHAEDVVRPILERFGYGHGLRLPLFSRDETFGQLVLHRSGDENTFAAEELPILEELARRMSIAIENARSFERERRVAATLQRVLLPTELSHIPGWRLDATYSPGAREAAIGGDWYDAFPLDDGRIVLSVGDVTGRGLQAAVIMGTIRQAIGVLALYETDPAGILDSVESIVLRHYPNAIVTAFIAVLDPARGTLNFANAGHPYPFARLEDGSVVELRSSGLPLGLRRMAESAPSTVRSLDDVRLLVLYTDGLVEVNRDISQGLADLRALVAGNAVMCVGDPAAMIRKATITGMGHDDIAVLTAFRLEAPRWSIRADNAAFAQHARRDFVRYLTERAGDVEPIGACEAIFGELVSNVVRHAPGPIDISLDLDETGAVLHVIDQGPPFRDNPSLPDNPLAEGGRGLFMIAQLAAGMTIERIPGFGNHVAVKLPVRSRAGSPTR